MELLGIEITDEEFDFLMCEQTKGKDLKVKDGKIVACEHVATKNEKYAQEISELKEWFNTTYTIQEQKLNRLSRLNQLTDDGVAPAEKLLELDKQAELNRKRIQQLEDLLKKELV